jgi:hypothetical protein
MLYSDVTAFFIILATAVALSIAGVTDMRQPLKPGWALRLLAGDFAYLLFALDILVRISSSHH